MCTSIPLNLNELIQCIKECVAVFDRAMENLEEQGSFCVSLSTIVYLKQFQDCMFQGRGSSCLTIGNTSFLPITKTTVDQALEFNQVM